MLLPLSAFPPSTRAATTPQPTNPASRPPLHHMFCFTSKRPAHAGCCSESIKQARASKQTRTQAGVLHWLELCRGWRRCGLSSPSAPCRQNPLRAVKRSRLQEALELKDEVGERGPPGRNGARPPQRPPAQAAAHPGVDPSLLGRGLAAGSLEKLVEGGAVGRRLCMPQVRLGKSTAATAA